MRITIDIDSLNRPAVTGDVQVSGGLEAEAAGPGPDLAAAGLAEDGAEDSGPPPQWLVEAIERASAEAPEGVSEAANGVEDAGHGPLD